MTGRRGRVVKTEKQPQPHYEARESDSSNVDSLNIQEVRASWRKAESRKWIEAVVTLYATISTCVRHSTAVKCLSMQKKINYAEKPQHYTVF